MRSPGLWLTAVALAAVLAGTPARGEFTKVEHPFLLWTPEELAALRKKIETEPWAREAYDRMVKSTERLGDELRNLFRCAVMGDKAAGEVGQ